MKKLFKYFIICLMIIPCLIIITSCGESNNTITITFDYGVANSLFKTTPEATTISSTDEKISLPEVNDQYMDRFIGWFIKGSETQVEENGSFSTSVTLEARFIVDYSSISSLYQNGKYIKTWDNLKTEYPQAFDDTSIISDESNRLSYFTNLSGELVIDETITNITDSAFKDCSGLTGINIPGGVINIANGAFNGCSGIESIVVDNDTNTHYKSEGNTIIDRTTKTIILGCKNTVLPSRTIAKSIGPEAFLGCTGLKEITLPGPVNKICDKAFEKCIGLERVAIMSNIESIGEYAFSSSGLKKIDIPGSIARIGYGAFYECEKLESIIIRGNELTTLEDYIFYNCKNLASIDVPGSLTKLGDHTFYGCGGITTIIVQPNSTNSTTYKNESNSIIKKSTNELVLGCKITDISQTTATSIGKYAFCGNKELEEINIPSTIRSIGEYAFEDCSGL